MQSIQKGPEGFRRATIIISFVAKPHLIRRGSTMPGVRAVRVLGCSMDLRTHFAPN